MAQCGNCSGFDACGADGTPNTCSPAVAEMCGGCPFGGEIDSLYNTVCEPSNSDCFNQQTLDLLCGRVAGIQWGCGMVCGASYHFAGTVPYCPCTSNSGLLNICIPNP
jgi:hypothetical protein